MQTFLLKAGYVATITTDAYSTAGWRVIGDANNAATAPTAIAASTSVNVGPYTADRHIAVDDVGTGVTYTIVFLDGQSYHPLVDPISLYAASGAITVQAGIAKITKSASAALMTLAAPTTAQDGIILRVISNTAQAHTITATTLINDGVIGGAKTTATFAAFVGAAITLVALDQAWTVLSSNHVTIS